MGSTWKQISNPVQCWPSQISDLIHQHLWETLSNALMSSNMTTSICSYLPLTRSLTKSWTVCKSCDLHESCWWKPCWTSGRILYNFKCCITLEYTSYVLQNFSMRETGWYLRRYVEESDHLFEYWYNMCMLPFSINLPLVNWSLKSSDSEGVISFADSFDERLEILSGLHA